MAEQLFASFTKRGLVLYRISVVSRSGTWESREPCIINMLEGGEERRRQEYKDNDLMITSMEALPTLETVMKAGKQYLVYLLMEEMNCIIGDQFKS